MTTKKLIPLEGQGYAQQQIKEIGLRFAQVQAALQPPFCVDSVEHPPFEHPPFEHPPFEHPPFEHPPSEHPPFEKPPSEHPPFEHPPFEQPPSEHPPFEKPPFEHPPFEQPPFEHPPFEHPPSQPPPFQPPPCESNVPAEPSTTTSVAWQTTQPTSSPGCGQPCGHGNGTHPSRPSPTPVTGAGSTLAVPGAAMALMMGVAFLL
ncbi:hypothetical protein F4824DRAFT_72651 [Ustulina deusta]|nr:hypothetical protein F4824DRAFT_72651 [Ustulina deusta]